MEILGKHIVIQKGKMPKNLSDEPSKKFIFPYVDIKAFEKKNIQRYTDGEKCLLCNDNDLLIVWDGARCGLVGKAIRGAVGSTLAIIRPKETLYKEYVYYFIKSQFRTFNTRVKGVGIPHLDPLIVHHSSLIIPSLPEQHRIVAKIEELFSDLDNGIENLKTAQQQLKTYRQAVLKYAFEGRFTNKVKGNPPKSGGRKERESEKGELPEGWKWVKLGEVSESCLGKMLDKQKNQGDYQPYLRNINVRWGNFDLSDLSEMKFEKNEKERFGIKNGDLVICEGGEPGRTAIWKDETKNMMIQKALHRVRFDSTVITKFFFHYLVYMASTKTLEQYFTGTTIKHLTGQSLKKISFPLPSVIEQKQIVQEIESRLSVCDKVEETITASLQQSESLRQSILKKAFEGKLV